jgi:hypothetical protein
VKLTPNILTETLAFLLEHSGKFSRFARIGTRMSAPVRWLGSIRSRWTRSCSPIPGFRSVSLTAFTVGLAFSPIPATHVAGICIAPLAAKNTIAGSVPANEARPTMPRPKGKRRRNASMPGVVASPLAETRNLPRTTPRTI